MATRNEYFHGLRGWVCFEALLPAFFVFALFWPVGSIIKHPQHWFERVFATGDMIPIAAVLLLGMACEIEQNRLFNQIESGWLETLRYGAFAFAILFLFLLRLLQSYLFTV